MSFNIVDVCFRDGGEILQIPIVSDGETQRIWETATQSIDPDFTRSFVCLANGVGIPNGFVEGTGRLFGQDTNQWRPLGTEHVDVTEDDNGVRQTKKTSVYTGIDLKLLFGEPYHDPRLEPAIADGDASSAEKQTIDDALIWSRFISFLPYTASSRRQRIAELIDKKCKHSDPILQREAAHALWELSVNRHSADDTILYCLMHCLDSPDMEVIRLGVMVIWSVSVSARHRQTLASLGIVSALVQLLHQSLDTDSGSVREDSLQDSILGALSILAVDRCCRERLLEGNTSLEDLLELCQRTASTPIDHKRQIIVSKLLASLAQRDQDIRQRFVELNGLHVALHLLNRGETRDRMVQFCMASILNEIVLDDAAMELVRERNACPMLLEECVAFLSVTLEELQSQGLVPEAAADESVVRDGLLLLRLCEGCAQTIWGSSFYCAHYSPDAVSLKLVQDLASLAKQSAQTTQVPLPRVTHCLTACLATFCSSPSCAERVVEDKEATVIRSLLFLLGDIETGIYSTDGHVIAAACTGLTFLACHPIGARGDDCMTGPHRRQLLEAGTYSALLSALISPPLDIRCRSIVEESAAIGVMYLSTMAGQLSANDLMMLSTLLKRPDNLQMTEYLTAGMWVLLRDSGNRNILAKAMVQGEASTEAEATIWREMKVQELADEQKSKSDIAMSENDSMEDDDWGLLSLVEVGEKWLESLVNSTVEEDSNAPILKLFEFLTASIGLFLVPTDELNDNTSPQIFEYDSDRCGWWTVKAENQCQRSEEATLDPLMKRTVNLLLALLQMQSFSSWKVVQLSIITLWNLSYRSAAIEANLFQLGTAHRLARICQNAKWPNSLRDCAGGFLHNCVESWSYVPHFSLEDIIEASVTMINTAQPLLELNGAQGLARYSWKVPVDCPRPKSYTVETKMCITEAKGIESLCFLLYRLNQRCFIFIRFTAASKLNWQPSGNSSSVQGEVFGEQSTLFERCMNTRDAIVESYEAALTALLNVSVVPALREAVGRHGLRSLLLASSMFTAEEALTWTSSERLSDLCSSVLQNLSLEHRNRTRFYKAELSGSFLTMTEDAPSFPTDQKQRPKIKKFSEGSNPNRNPSTKTSSDGSDFHRSRDDPPFESFREWMEEDVEEFEKHSANIKQQRASAVGHSKQIEKNRRAPPSKGATASALQMTLCRPLSHSWTHPASLRTCTWHPRISEYRQTSASVNMTGIAKHLLSVDCSNMATSANDPSTPSAAAISDAIIQSRPSTSARDEGRTPIIVLDTLSLQHTPYNVILSPQRLRTSISFCQSSGIMEESKGPRLTIFQQSNGSRVSRDLFNSYTLPNGAAVYYHYTDGSVVNEQETSRRQPPPRPTSIPAALQEGMPLTKVLDIIAKPPGTGVRISTYRFAPRLAPLPSMHTLPVKNPNSIKREDFGDLRDDYITLQLQLNAIQETRVIVTKEKIANGNQKEIWSLPTSIFKPRLRESDSRGFYDTPSVFEKSFEIDWNRCMAKEKFASMLAREFKASKTDDGLAVHDCLKRHYWALCSAFLYFAAMGTGSLFHLTLNSFTTFLDECGIVVGNTKRSDCDTIFIVANFVTDKKSPDTVHNNEQALMRFEFMEALVRIAILKYIKNDENDNVSEAIDRLFEANVESNLSPSMSIDRNVFREQRLYSEDVDLIFKKHAPLLKAVYSRYRMKPAGGGLRSKTMKIDGWLLLMDETRLINADFTLLDAQLCYLRSRMWVQDEIKDFTKYGSLSFVDFLEALGRVADQKRLPTKSDLMEQGFDNVFQWYQEHDSSDDSSAQKQASQRPRLGDLLDVFLDLVFRTLHYDPNQPMSIFSHDLLLRIIKKKDKDLGP